MASKTEKKGPNQTSKKAEACASKTRPKLREHREQHALEEEFGENVRRGKRPCIRRKKTEEKKVKGNQISGKESKKEEVGILQRLGGKNSGGIKEEDAKKKGALI